MKVCAVCAEHNPDRARFCLECGAALPGDRPPERRERRVVSVLFADLVGFTSRSESMDVEDVEGLLTRYQRLVRRELERHGGTVEKFIGDAVMAVFGAPVTYEDDPERAVRAALAIQEAVAELRGEGIDVHVRAGVTTGEALVVLGSDPRAGEGMASGDVINTAARLQTAAPVDGVLVDEATRRATERGIRYEAAAPVTAKGKRDAVAAWRAVETRSLLPEQARLEDLPLVGREDEIAQLTSALGRARRDPSTQLVTLIGAPGIGKTRLVQELATYVDALPDIVRWRRGRSLAYGEGVSFWALGEMVKAEAGILESDSATAAEGKLGSGTAALLADERDRTWVTRQLRPLVGLDTVATGTAEAGRIEAFAAWRRFFEALAEDGPTVLVFEDLHWADDDLLDFIDLLAERAGAVPLLIVCTARPELLARRPGWGGGKTNTQTLQLSALSPEDTARLVSVLLDQALLPAGAQAALLVRADGNPLYAQEYVRMLLDRGVLVQEGGVWRLAGEIDGLPASLQAIIAARLDTLRDEERRLLHDAAVVGKTAWVGAVCAISGLAPAQVEELVHDLERKQLVRRLRRSSVRGEVEFSFAHALTQEVAYAQIRRLERAEKHERTAAWIEQLAGERDDKAGLLAHHYTRALTLREQAGEDATPLVPRARTTLVEAGRQALAVNAYGTATRHLRAALDLTPDDDPGRARLLLDHARASYWAGQVEESMLQAALDAQVAAGRSEAAAEASLLLSEWLDYVGGVGERAEAIAASGMEHATRDGYAPVASLLAERQVRRLLVTGRRVEALRFSEDAIRRAELAGDPQGRAMLLSWRGQALVANGDAHGFDEQREGAEALAALASPTTMVVFHNLAEGLALRGDLRRAGDARLQAASWADRFGQSAQIAAAAAGQADAAYHAGEWERALRLSHDLVDHPLEWMGTYARWSRGRIALARGDMELPLSDALRIIDYATRSANDEVLVEGLALAALAHHARGEPAEAEDARQRLLARVVEVGGMVAGGPALVELAAVSGELAGMDAPAALLPDMSRWKHALTALAEQRWADAAQICGDIGSRPLQAAAQLRAAEDAAARGRARDASAHASRALGFFRAVGAERAAAQAQRLLDAVGEARA